MQRPRESAVLALPGLLVVALFILWAAGEGGIDATVWYPGAIFCLALLVLLGATATRLLRPPRRSTLAAVGLLGAFVLWSFLSITWADVKGDAWDGANRSLLYLTVYALFALWPWSTQRAALLLGTFALGTASLGVISLVRATASADPAGFFIDARFVEPLGYANAESGLFLTAFWPAVFLASRRQVPVLVRALMLGAAGVLLELAILPQSRGAVFAGSLTLVLFLGLVPGRIRSVVALVPVAATAFLARGPLLDLYADVDSGLDPGASLASARNAVGLSFLALALVGLLLAFPDRRLAVSERTARAAGVTLAVAATTAAVAALTVLVLVSGNPTSRVKNEWKDFKSGYQATEEGSRFSRGVGSNRYDFWRVALGEFKAHPVRGIGADNFAVPYVKRRSSIEESQYPHSLEIMVLSQTGVIGFGLFAGFLACALLAAFRRASAQSGFGKALTAVCVVTFGYWLVHGSVDWFWELPALTGSALASLGIAGSAEAGLVPTRVGGRLLAKAIAVGAAAVAVLAGLASFTLPWLAARDVARASEIWRQDGGQAFSLLDRARRLNPLSDRPDSFAGAIASRRGEWARMRDAFSKARDRNPGNWYTHLELALANAKLGRSEAALGELRNAKALNPLEPVIDDVRALVEEGKPVVPAEIDRRFVLRAEERMH